jgi:hypothetical protein
MTNGTESTPAKAPVVIYKLYVSDTLIGEYNNEIEMAMAASKFISMNGEDNTTVQIYKDGQKWGKTIHSYWANKLPELFLFANQIVAQINALNAQLEELKELSKNISIEKN